MVVVDSNYAFISRNKSFSDLFETYPNIAKQKGYMEEK